MQVEKFFVLNAMEHFSCQITNVLMLVLQEHMIIQLFSLMSTFKSKAKYVYLAHQDAKFVLLLLFVQHVMLILDSRQMVLEDAHRPNVLAK